SSQEAVPFLIKAIGDQELKSYAVIALGEIGPGAEAAVPALIECVKRDGCYFAINSLGRIGPKAKRAVSVLMEVANKRGGEASAAAAFALWCIDRKNPISVPVLCKALQDKDPDVRCQAIDSLGQMGSDAQKASPLILKALQDKERVVQLSAALALLRVKHSKDRVLPVFKSGL